MSARAEAAIKRLHRAQGQPRFDNSTARTAVGIARAALATQESAE